MTNLTLDSILTFGIDTWVDRKVKLGKILYELKEEFPDGFYGREATLFLKKTTIGVPKDFGGGLYGIRGAGTFYKALVEVGYLERLEEKTKQERIAEGSEYKTPHNRTIPFYKVKEDLSLEQYRFGKGKIRHRYPAGYQKSRAGSGLVEPEQQVQYELPFPKSPWEMKIDGVEFSVRTINSFENAGIKTIGELVQKTEEELLKSKNFGRKSLNEIKEVFRDMGLHFGMTYDEYKARLHSGSLL